MDTRPNVILILADDMGYSDLSCFGGEIQSKHLDRLADKGVRLTQFYNSPRCSPSRASLLTGLHPHQVGIGILTDDDRPEGYTGNLSDQCITIAEVLKDAGYGTYMSGKWHLASDTSEVNDAWPTRRGFDKFFGTLSGAGSYYDPTTLTRDERNIEEEAQQTDFFYTDAITDNAVAFLDSHFSSRPADPFFLYVAYTAPHFPLHAPEEDVASYRGTFQDGWDSLRPRRLGRLRDMGILDSSWSLSDRDLTQPAWADVDDKPWQSRRMEVYAAQVERMDRGIGEIVARLEKIGSLDNTIIIFLSDNGGCAEELPLTDADVPAYDYGRHEAEIMRYTTRQGKPVRVGNRPEIIPGPEDTYASYGRAWANLSNTPFRYYKHWVHEGGISTPFILHWPAALSGVSPVCHVPYQLPDVMATLIEATGSSYPKQRDGLHVPPPEGHSMLPGVRGEALDHRWLFWEHEGNAGARLDNWKLVRKYPDDWELYDMALDRTELNDLSHEHPEIVASMSARYEEWARRCGVIPRENILDLYERRRTQS